MGHIVKHWPRVQFSDTIANYVSTAQAHDTKRLIDSTTSHDITGDLANLLVHSEYDGMDEVIIDDDSSLWVLHIDSLAFHSPKRTFY